MILKQFTSAALIMLTAAAVFGGGKSQNSGAGTPDGEKQTLVIGMQANSFVTDYENNYLTQYMENLHNINLDFYMLPFESSEVRTKISLMVSSNDLPDIFQVGGVLNGDQIMDYGSKGAFIALNKYLADPVKAPNFAAIPKADQDAMYASMIRADGNIYSLPNYEPNIWNETPHRIFINQAWLTRLGLKIPSTTDELRNVLLAFRDRDPNGNGKKDEIGLYGRFAGGYGENTIATILNAFIFYNRDNLSLDGSGNKVIAPFTDPAFRKGLVYLNTLYKDGVLAASLFTDDQQQFRAVLNNEPNILGLTSAGSMGNWQDRTKPSFTEMTLIPPLTGPDGVSYTPYQPYLASQIAMITSKCKNPDLAFKFLESFFNLENSRIARYGEEGVDWSRKPEDLAKDTAALVEAGLFPKLTLIQLIYLWAKPSNKTWHNTHPRYATLEMASTVGNLNSLYDRSNPSSVYTALHYQWYSPRHPDKVLPVLKYNPEDAAKNAELIANINEYVRQSIAEFVTGARDIGSDAAWNGYIRELDNMGLQQWITSAQATYERQKR